MSDIQKNEEPKHAFDKQNSASKRVEDNVSTEKSDGARMGDGYTLALNFVLSILICTAFGYWLDTVFETKPWLMLVFLVLGFSSGLWKIYGEMTKEE